MVLWGLYESDRASSLVCSRIRLLFVPTFLPFQVHVSQYALTNASITRQQDLA